MSLIFDIRLRGKLLVTALLALITACGNEPARVSRTLLGTVVTITVADEPAGRAGDFNAAFNEIEYVQRSFSIYDPASEIYRVNKSAYEHPCRVSGSLFELLKASVEVSEKTGGAFDITWASAGRIWDFSNPERFTPPDDKTVKSLLPLISYKNIRLDDKAGTVRFLKPGVKIGLGGVAKGYAVKRAVGALKSRGVKGAIVACAGDIQVIGDNRGRPWRAGIQDPRGKSVIATFDMRDGEAVSTSGDYERFRIVDGKRYHHIINPATGYPADSGLISVTVFSRDPVKADAYATAFFVSGFDKTGLILSSAEDISVVLVTSDMKVYASVRLRERLAFREDIKAVYF